MNDEDRERCHTCDHWRTEYCDVDGNWYCEADYPAGVK